MASPIIGTMSPTSLVGKWVWVWNWRRCEDGDAARVAGRLVAAGCRGALVKAFDGPYWFDQGQPWRAIARELKAQGVAVGGWGYLYGRDPAGEAQRAIETAHYGEADLLVLDVESEFKGQPGAAEEVCRRIREALGPDYPLYFSSFAIARYHASFPFEVFRRYCTGAAPQVYWNAFRWPLEQSLRWTYEDYTALGIPPQDVFPVGGLYREGFVQYPDADDVRAFVRGARERGSSGVSFWSYEHMSDEMWQAVAAEAIGSEEEPEMSSQEYQQVSQSLSELGGRIQRLEADVGALKAAGVATAQPGTGPSGRTYTVQPGDTLSGIAVKLGLGSWQRLYDANVGVIGADPDRIYPGQVLVVPS